SKPGVSVIERLTLTPNKFGFYLLKLTPMGTAVPLHLATKNPKSCTVSLYITVLLLNLRANLW
ncbi:hypothetical protein, partial [Tolypothrix sp. VBCCA 56010]|uniref:hypothetical protein n=1 Tax=Tolypothrix sp. VBCCA 56010 TaxID=3137731 RepID=UPI003D7CC0B7